MEDNQAIKVMSALAQPTRLKVYSLLAEHHPEGMAAGAIAQHVGSPPNTMSAHLTIMSHAGLVSSSKDGRSVIYLANTELVADLITFLGKPSAA